MLNETLRQLDTEGESLRHQIEDAADRIRGYVKAIRDKNSFQQIETDFVLMISHIDNPNEKEEALKMKESIVQFLKRDPETIAPPEERGKINYLVDQIEDMATRKFTTPENGE